MSTDTVAQRAPTRDEAPLDLSSCPCAWAERRIAEYEAGIRERRTVEELAEALAEEEERLGREMAPREAQAFALGFFSPGYDTGLFAEMLTSSAGAARVVGHGLPIKDDVA